jgi:D-alanine-D-alanine ligase
VQVLVLYNEPALATADNDAAAEAGVLESVEAVSAVLARRGHQPHALGLSESQDQLKSLLTELPSYDAVFNLFEGFGGLGRGEAEISGLVELLTGAMTGSPADCLALVRHKARTKWMLAGAGIPTPEFVLLEPGQPIDLARLDSLLAAGALIVKPAHEDASQGIHACSIVTDRQALLEQVEIVRSAYGDVLVERFVVGREFNVAVLELDQPQVLPVAEIEFGGAGRAGWQIVTYDAKWAAGSRADLETPVRCPAHVDETVARHIRALALASFRITGCRDYARVDMRMDPNGQVFVLEVNGNPDIGPSAGYARALAAAGYEYDNFIERLTCRAHERGRSCQFE